MMDSVPIVKELLLIGGGHTHALVLRRWGMRPVPGVRVTLVSPEATAPYTGMLPGHIAGHYPREALDIDLVRLARFAGARFIPGHVVGLDPGAGIATLAAGRRVSYDLASLDIGITADMDTLPGFAAHGIPAKPLGRFATHWAEVAAGSGPVRIAVLGGGVAGAEIAMACAHRLTAEGRAFSISLIDRGRVLGSVPSAARAHLVAALEGWGIELIAQDAPAEVLADAVLLDSGRRVAADLIIGAAGAVPQGWLEGAGLDLHEGFVLVDRTLRSTSHATIYAAGDCAHFAPDPRPKAGVYAVRAAPVLAHNLAADLTGRQRRAFRPQRDFLKLISLGGKTAVAEKAGIALAGPALWRWKDRIDARFMEKLRDLPAMSVPKAPAHAATGVARRHGRARALRGMRCKARLGRAFGGDRGARRRGARGYRAAAWRRCGDHPAGRCAAGHLDRSPARLRAGPRAGGPGGGGACAGRCLGHGGGAAIRRGHRDPAPAGAAPAGGMARRGDGRGPRRLRGRARVSRRAFVDGGGTDGGVHGDGAPGPRPRHAVRWSCR
jgi:selenide,water dikinase